MADPSDAPSPLPLLGILGGMGPLATADFLAKVTLRTPAHRDQDHLRTLTLSDPTVPDRTAALQGDGPSPLPALREGVAFLNRSGCSLIAIPCNTAHFWHSELQGESLAPILHIVDAVLEVAGREAPALERFGVLATNGTVTARIYHDRLEARGKVALDLSDLGERNPIPEGIRAVKAGELDRARGLFEEGAEHLVERGAEGLLLGCTELSSVLDASSPLAGVPVWDASEALAEACVARMRSPRFPRAGARALSLVGALALLAGCGGADPRGGGGADPGPWDLLVQGGTVIDGTGTPGFRADVAVREGRIVRVSLDPLPAGSAERVISAEGQVVAPGFIDLHTHLEPLPELPGAESHVRQGVTLALGGPDGTSPWPLAPYLDEVESRGLGMNVAFLVGHNTVREGVMGSEDRAPTPEELEEMKRRIAQGMEDGAFGISTGLRYSPGVFSDPEEVIELSRVAAEAGGFYTSHLRDEGFDLLQGVGEALEIGRRAGIPVILSHHKVVGAPNWGASLRTLALVDSARAAGTDAMLDQYPYTATHTGISILLPPWALGGGTDAFLARLDDPELRARIFEEVVWNLVNDRGGNDLSRVQFSRVAWDPSLEGRTLQDWAEREGLPLSPESGAELVFEAMRRGGANAIFHALHEDDIERILRHPFTAVASDGRLSQPGDGHPHPRAYGTFPRVLGPYVRERGVLSLEDAIRKMSSLPADRMGLSDRGRIAEGAWADLVILDPATVTDRSTYADPHQYPEGIPFVIVNGIVVVDDGVFTEARPGRALRRPGSPADPSPSPR